MRGIGTLASGGLRFPQKPRYASFIPGASIAPSAMSASVMAHIATGSPHPKERNAGTTTVGKPVLRFASYGYSRQLILPYELDGVS